MDKVVTNEDKEQDTYLKTEFRGNLVDTAVKFLLSPKVIAYDEQSKTNFLEKKGLTKEEIQTALQRAASERNSTNYSIHNATANQALYNDKNNNSNYHIVPIAPLQPPASPARHGFWSFLKDFANFFVLISGIAFSFQYVYKHYIYPYLTGNKKKSSKETLIEVQHSIMSVLQQISATLENLDHKINEHNHILKNLNSAEDSLKTLNYSGLEEIQAEIKTIKGLLINRNTFPSAPSIPPLLPEWQKIIPQQDSDHDKNMPNGTDNDTAMALPAVFEI